MNALSNARQPGEKFLAYRARRTALLRQVDAYLRGTMVHESTRIVQLPLLGDDAEVDRAVTAGQFRDVVLQTLPGGRQTRVARTKGVTYRKPKAAA